MTDRPWLKGQGERPRVRAGAPLRLPAFVALMCALFVHELSPWAGVRAAVDGATLAPPSAPPWTAGPPLLAVAGANIRPLMAEIELAAEAEVRAESAQEHAPAPHGPALIEARARGLQIEALGEARAAAEAGDWARARPALEDLWVRSEHADIQDEALQLLLSEATADWPADHRGAFLRMLMPKAMRSARAARVPASVTVGQAIIESGWGRSSLTRRHHNLFGVKGGGVRLRTREFNGGRWRRTQATYRSYGSLDESIAHHAALLNGPHFVRYKSLWVDWRAYLPAIASKYASSPGYVRSVGSMITRYDLDRFDALIIRAAAHDAQQES